MDDVFAFCRELKWRPMERSASAVEPRDCSLQPNR